MRSITSYGLIKEFSDEAGSIKWKTILELVSKDTDADVDDLKVCLIFC